MFQNTYKPVNHFGFDKYTKTEMDLNLFGGITINEAVVGSTEKDKDKLEARVSESIIQTEGSDLITILGMDGIDSNRTWVNDLPEIYDVLGVEAAR